MRLICVVNIFFCCAIERLEQILDVDLLRIAAASAMVAASAPRAVGHAGVGGERDAHGFAVVLEIGGATLFAS